jgi:hypothetical protein
MAAVTSSDPSQKSCLPKISDDQMTKRHDEATLMRCADWLIVLVVGVAMVVRTAVVVVVFVLE